MNAVVALAPHLRRAGGRDTRVTTALSVTAFAVSTALTLSVLGGLLGFAERAAHPADALQRELGTLYVQLAWTALILLVVPLVTLAGAAARMGVARRDARLATLRLLGATPREVVALSLLETCVQGLVGAVVGVLGYVALLPLWALVPFQGGTFSVGELWVGPLVVLAVLVSVPVLAAVSGLVSLRRVVVSPLGVARRTTPPGLKVVRVVVLAVALVGFAIATAAAGRLAAALVAVLLGFLAAGFGAMNLVGPWVLGIMGRVQARRARTPVRLLAARRLVDDPRGAWRVVGGLGLAGFVAGALAVVPMFTSGQQVDRQGEILNDDLVTGAMLTLVIAFLLAAVSAGIQQASTVLDRRREYALAHLAGMPVELLDAVRRREVTGPMVRVAGGSSLVAVVMLSPLFKTAAFTDWRGIVLLVGCLVGGCLLVLAATETSRPLLRSVLTEPLVRAD
ncbi:hypothetical protein GXP71_14500 [Cellulomonas sp. H30R-01]|uniref:FtsX-like permease family protein n=1 Tax=Cellulomonas sp. H30R-01 TaxID=2704467 RepID=UPI00138D2F6E|nr:FtsX-like permease family protein [Cellulomonas sp. H30R-01]QHT57168.1 hypothetical protein GXP71_14500 [Cellulomonas sp. H30R-01]